MSFLLSDRSVRFEMFPHSFRSWSINSFLLGCFFFGGSNSVLTSQLKATLCNKGAAHSPLKLRSQLVSASHRVSLEASSSALPDFISLAVWMAFGSWWRPNSFLITSGCICVVWTHLEFA